MPVVLLDGSLRCPLCTFPCSILNARSLLPKLDELCVLNQLESPDIICIVESWLSSEIENNEITIDNYQLVRHDRNRHGGGVLMYVKSCLSVNVLSVG